MGARKQTLAPLFPDRKMRKSHWVFRLMNLHKAIEKPDKKNTPHPAPR